jgi:hypothetical protein
MESALSVQTQGFFSSCRRREAVSCSSLRTVAIAPPGSLKGTRRRVRHTSLKGGWLAEEREKCKFSTFGRLRNWPWVSRLAVLGKSGPCRACTEFARSTRLRNTTHPTRYARSLQFNEVVLEMLSHIILLSALAEQSTYFLHAHPREGVSD